MMMSASLLQEGDVVLVVTHSGRTSDVKAAVELAKKNGAKIICITHSYHSPIAKLADYIICSPAPETPLLGRNASARILQLTLLDAFLSLSPSSTLNKLILIYKKPAQLLISSHQAR